MASKKRALLKALTLIFGLVSVYYWFLGLNHTLTEPHAFRQTQTAITVDTMLKGGPWLAYEIPVFGPPWSAPFEFPLYQWVVALGAKAELLPLVPMGRVVSILFFVLSLFPFWGILRRLEFDYEERLIFLMLFLSSPIYLFWSRTFMIESAAFFFCMGYAYYTQKYIHTSSRTSLITASLLGCCGALIKITTFVGFSFFAALMTLGFWFAQRDQAFSRKVLQKLMGIALFLAVTQILLTEIWVQYTDVLKSQNPLTNHFITSDALQKWNFGTLKQKLSWSETWSHLLRREIKYAVGVIYGLIVGFLGLVYFDHRDIKRFLLALLLFVLPMMVFTNLHAVHDYYGYANGVFCLSALGIAIVGLVRHDSPYAKSLGYLLLLYTLGANIQRFQSPYGNRIRENHTEIAELGEKLQTLSSPESITFIWGLDWSPEIPFYMQRRVVMDRGSIPLDGPLMTQVLHNLKGYSIGGLLFCGGSQFNQDFVQERVQFFKANPTPFLSERCHAYPISTQ